MSLRRPGFCFVGIAEDGSRDIRCFSVDNKKNTKKPHSEILKNIYDTFVSDVKALGDVPKVFVREKAFNARGSQAEIGIYKVVGIMDLCLNEIGGMQKEWIEFYPVTVKKKVTDSGTANKDQVRDAVNKLMPPYEYQNDDESDAAAVALTYLLTNEQSEDTDHGNS